MGLRHRPFCSIAISFAAGIVSSASGRVTDFPKVMRFKGLFVFSMVRFSNVLFWRGPSIDFAYEKNGAGGNYFSPTRRRRDRKSRRRQVFGAS